jgi:hypothetical protein
MLFIWLKSRLWKRRIVVTSYEHPRQTRLFELSSRIIDEADLKTSSITMNEASQIYRIVRATSKIDGDIAEVGVYKGGTAKIICEAKAHKTLHLFDTFEGLPELSEKDNPRQFHENQYSCSLERVKDYLKGYSNVFFYKGLFPTTAGPVEQKKFSFVHLDVDLYESTMNSLVFFYPRMAVGGVLISHDYLWVDAVRKAFDEFFKDKVEPIIELTDNQCMIVKC